jgi:hypothetical protein
MSLRLKAGIFAHEQAGVKLPSRLEHICFQNRYVLNPHISRQILILFETRRPPALFVTAFHVEPRYYSLIMVDPGLFSHAHDLI